MKGEIIEITARAKLTSVGIQVKKFAKNRRIILKMRDANFVETIQVEGFDSIDDVIGRVYVHIPTFEAGGKPFCVIMKNGALLWYSVDDHHLLIKMIQNPVIMSTITDMRMFKTFLEL